MIVCICHRISDRDIVAAVRSGTTCFEVLQDDTRLASSCGCCHDCAKEVFDTACAQACKGGAAAPVHLVRQAAAMSSHG